MTQTESPDQRLLIVVGASSELAQEIGLFLGDGYKYVVPLSRAAGTLRVGTKDFSTVPYDPLDPESMRELFKSASFPSKAEVVSVHLVSFAGSKDRNVFVNLSSVDVLDVVESNLMTNIWAVQFALQKYLGKPMSIVLMSSSGAIRGGIGTTVYSACKHALRGLVMGVSIEYGKLGVRANLIELGVLPVGLKKTLPPKRLDEMRLRTSTRNLVSVESVARSIKFVLETDDVSGASISCDGGYF